MKYKNPNQMEQPITTSDSTLPYIHYTESPITTFDTTLPYMCGYIF